ncbi:MAG: peptide deformylase [Candidatus Dadabacteria bacterium]|nr:peptide deformylase [Candidatus Dadabacteria bacterium]MDE0477470.1 peptide deformylase [Candidatus Dadabacteria bacterium]
MANQREITELGNPVLRQRAPRVENISGTETQELIDDMILTAAEANGVGIAAPQVSESLRIFIIAGSLSSRYPDAPETEVRVVINPEIVSVSDEVEKGWEGCLSIPGIRALVPRYKSVRAVYRDRDNNLVEEDFSDFAARVFQHEYDHINGVVFIDRVESPLEIITEREYMKLVTQSDSEEQE